MKKLFTIIGAMLLTMSVNAQTTLNIDPFRIGIGEEKVITLNLSNTDLVNASAFYCDVYLPEGIEIEKNESGDFNLSIADESGRASSSQFTIFSQLQDGGAVRIVCFPVNPEKFNVLKDKKNSEISEAEKLTEADVQALSGTSGAVINIPLVAAQNLVRSSEILNISNQEITDLTGTSSKKPKTAQSDFLVFLRGDVNVDGKTNITDVAYDLDKINGVINEGFDESSADVNEDGKINITDVALILDIINDVK